MRCYNGQPDSDLQARLDHDATVRAAIVALGYSVTYFPEGEFYQAFDARHLQVGPECKTLDGVLAALRHA